MIKKIKNITLFIDEKIITDVKGSVQKFVFPALQPDITLPYYIVDGVFDSLGESKIFTLMPCGNTTLKILQEMAIKETKYRKQLKRSEGTVSGSAARLRVETRPWRS